MSVLERFGGFSFGEENILSVVNSSQIADAIDDLTSAFNNGTSVIPERFTNDFKELLEYAITEDNARVGFLACP